MSLAEMNYWFSEKEGIAKMSEGDKKMSGRDLKFKVSFDTQAIKEITALFTKMYSDERIDKEIRNEYTDLFFKAINIKY